MTTREDLTRLMLQLTDQADLEARELLMTEDCEWAVPGYACTGRAGTTAFSRPMLAAFPDAAHQLDVVFADGDYVVVEGRWNGNHTGPLATPRGEIPATGRPLTLPFSMVTRFEGDLIASVHVYFDQMGFLAQLGLLPAPAAV